MHGAGAHVACAASILARTEGLTRSSLLRSTSIVPLCAVFRPAYPVASRMFWYAVMESLAVIGMAM